MKHRNNNSGLKNLHKNEKNGLIAPSVSGINCEECGTSMNSSGLHRFDCLPDHLKFNQFVRTGYRMNLNTWECLRSLFYLHNETFNIYSHGVAALLLTLAAPYVYGKLTLRQNDPLLYSVHHVTPIICLLCSAVYHLMMCHKKGAKLYDKLIKLDMLGIWLVTTFGTVAFIKSTFFCFPKVYNIVLLVYTIIAFITLAYVAKGSGAAERMRPLIYLGILRILVIYGSRGYMGLFGYTTGTVHAIWCLLAMELFGFFGGMINISRFPERWYHGKLDYLCNSHNLLHIMVLICPIFLHFGTVLDFKWMESAQCNT